MSSLPSDPATTAALARLAGELTAIRTSIDGLGERLSALATENAALRAQVTSSETARNDLLAQTEHILEMLASSRQEIRELQRRA